MLHSNDGSLVIAESLESPYFYIYIQIFLNTLQGRNLEHLHKQLSNRNFHFIDIKYAKLFHDKIKFEFKLPFLYFLLLIHQRLN